MVPKAMAADVEGLVNFTVKREYTTGLFSDVSEGKWYTSNIKTAYELGLVNGSSGGNFDINGSISIAETLALACRINSIYYGGDGDFQQESPWYQVYVDYAQQNKINIPTTAYTAKATRTQFTEILASSLPLSAFSAINNVADIPDVSASDEGADYIYLFYNAGILGGSDEYGTFNPNSEIKRSEVATILTRIVAENRRVSVNLAQKPVEVTSIAFNNTAYEVNYGSTITLSVKYSPSDATSTLTWSSSDASVASVSNGVVNGAKAGSAIITVTTANGKSAKCTINVVKNSSNEVKVAVLEEHENALKSGRSAAYACLNALDAMENKKYYTAYIYTKSALDYYKNEAYYLGNAITKCGDYTDLTDIKACLIGAKQYYDTIAVTNVTSSNYFDCINSWIVIEQNAKTYLEQITDIVKTWY
jgi:hypothetical protein